MRVYFGDIYGISGPKAEARRAIRGIAHEAVMKNRQGQALPVAFFCKSAVVDFDSREPVAEDWLVFTQEDMAGFNQAVGSLRKFEEAARGQTPRYRHLANRFIHALECKRQPDKGLTNAFFELVGGRTGEFPAIPHPWTKLAGRFPSLSDYITADAVNCALAKGVFDVVSGRMPEKLRETVAQETATGRPLDQTGQLTLSAFA